MKYREITEGGREGGSMWGDGVVGDEHVGGEGREIFAVHG